MGIMRVRATLTGTQGLPGLSTLYAFGTSATPSSADCSDMVARVRAFWEAIKALMPAGVFVLVSGDVDVLDETNGALVTGFAVASPATVVATGSEALPLATSMLLTHQTGTIIDGRRLKGRTFISPVSDSTNIDGLTTSASRATIAAAANAMITGSTSSFPVVWHRPKLPGPFGGTIAPTTSFSVGSNYATLRSRRD